MPGVHGWSDGDEVSLRDPGWCRAGRPPTVAHSTARSVGILHKPPSVTTRRLGTADAVASTRTASTVGVRRSVSSLRLVRANPSPLEDPFDPVPTLASLLPPVLVLRERYGLSEREGSVALQVAEGARNREIAAGMGLSVHTVRRHVEGLMKKLRVHTRSAVLPRLLTERFR